MPNEVRVPVSDVQAGMRYRLHVEPGLIVEGEVVTIDHRDRLWLKLDPQYERRPANFALIVRRSGVRLAEKLW